MTKFCLKSEVRWKIWKCSQEVDRGTFTSKLIFHSMIEESVKKNWIILPDATLRITIFWRTFYEVKGKRSVFDILCGSSVDVMYIIDVSNLYVIELKTLSRYISQNKFQMLFWNLFTSLESCLIHQGVQVLTHPQSHKHNESFGGQLHMLSPIHLIGLLWRKTGGKSTMYTASNSWNVR